MAIFNSNTDAAGSTVAAGYDIDTDLVGDGGMSQEFSTGSLGSWVPGGSTVAGTIDLLTVPATPLYQLVGGALFLQPKNGTADSASASVRIPLNLADGQEVVIAMSLPYATGALGNNALWAGLSFNNDDSSFEGGTSILFLYDGGDDNFTSWDGVTKRSTAIIPTTSATIYMRAIRKGDWIHIWVCYDVKGRAWVPISSTDTVATGHDTLWIVYRASSLADYGGGITIGPMMIRWVRQTAHTGILP